MLNLLKASSAESEERSEKISEDFLGSDITIDQFLEQFKPSRMEMHLRKLKADKMQELLRQGMNGQRPTQPNYPNFYGGGAAAPYPPNVGGFPMMPMPPGYRPPY